LVGVGYFYISDIEAVC